MYFASKILAAAAAEKRQAHNTQSHCGIASTTFSLAMVICHPTTALHDPAQYVQTRTVATSVFLSWLRLFDAPALGDRGRSTT